MAVLTPQQRNTLEAAVKQARKVAELGAFNALQGMAVNHPEPFAHMDAEQRKLRNQLWAKAKLLGDGEEKGQRKIQYLSYELAYETWHKMLFAKFLEANGLLMHTDGVAVTMEDCEELAKEEGFVDKWDAAANYASKMLPAIFRTDDPLMQVAYATDERIKLETIIDALENQIFIADDALGWVYQFWQTDEKKRINDSGDKIDGEKLPAVTQLFTEPYMVHFLIDNTLGAWWVSRNPGVKPPVKFEYLRFANVAPASSRSNEDSPAGSWNYFNPYDEINHIKGNLPHWRQEGKIYFVTFRTADSMPQEKLKEWQEELDAWKAQNPEPHTKEQKKEYYKRFPAKIQEYLDAGHGACHLKNENVKSIVENALKFFDGERYILDEYVVAANHVHVLLTPKEDHQLSDILHSWKSFTANEINKITGEKGSFWQKESFDHLVRSEVSLEKFREYIRNHDELKVDSASSRIDSNLRQDGGDTIENTLVPAAGKFEGWPDKTAEVTALDPCMGSGHFVASLFPVFAALRMHEEGLTKEQATDKVIAENLHGLELDARCTQIAAFNLALTAWKFCGYYKELPEMNLACSGIAPKGKVEDWVKLVGKVERADDKIRLENGMKMLYEHFQLAPELGSLLDPTTIKADAFTASFEELQPVLKRALENEVDTEQLERGVMAAGIAKAGYLLANSYCLLITNPPFLGKGKYSDFFNKYADIKYKTSNKNLATIFVERLAGLQKSIGVITVIMPQDWLYSPSPSYKAFRKNIIENKKINFIVNLGAGAFEEITGEVVKVICTALTKTKPKSDECFFYIELSEIKKVTEKSNSLSILPVAMSEQKKHLNNPDSRIILQDVSAFPLLESIADGVHGLGTKDSFHFINYFWEISSNGDKWEFMQSASDNSMMYSGTQKIILWEKGEGLLNERARNGLAVLAGAMAHNKPGVLISQVGNLKPCIYLGSLFEKSAAVISISNDTLLPAIWCFTNSKEYINSVKAIDKKIAVTNKTLVKVPFNVEYWQKVADDQYPNGLPKPYSDDPTQWLFHGHPIKTENPLQVALARVLDYRWPAESDTDMELADEARALIEAVKAFDHLSDEDGIFCIPSVNAEQAGAERLRDYLQQVFAGEWNNQTITQLLNKEGAKSSNLEAWLRDEFFVQHCKVFQNRPFIWHIWDGRKDGFSALINYHKLTKDNLSKIIYTYLGDWIRMCEAKRKAEESGAEGLLSAALKLKEKLEAILEGEAPHDIFVRWKSIDQQPIGWDPDLNDGVRLNIRPFVEAGVLRSKFNVKWGVDRGKNPPNHDKEKYPEKYFSEIRDNDQHIPLEEKRASREKKK
jgi:REP element-mobilizing transposase RayT